MARALKRCHFGDYRFSEDLDFTLARAAEFSEIREGLEEVFEYVARASGIRFALEREDRQSPTNSYTFYLSYQGPLPNPNTVKVDITISEVLCFEVERRPVLRAYPEFEDLPEDRMVAVYGLNEIATEKVVALSDQARNEPRDLYDLWFLIVHAGVDLSRLVPAIAQKLRFRQKDIAGLEGRILQKEHRRKATVERPTRSSDRGVDGVRRSLSCCPPRASPGRSSPLRVARNGSQEFSAASGLGTVRKFLLGMVGERPEHDGFGVSAAGCPRGRICNSF